MNRLLPIPRFSALLVCWLPLWAAEVSFDREVRPILASACLQCHGPDADSREAGLRLDTREGATALLESGARAVVPGKPGESELLARLDHADPDERMPPAETGKILTAKQRATLHQWIVEGASWEQHWAYRPMREPVVPKPDAWDRTPADAFIREQHRRHGLKPAPEADRRTLIRRLFNDLIGLPPPPEEVAAFMADESPYAYERLVDRLLASPHYGERWGRHWLDVVKYADTHGYDKDKLRPNAWPYRDYVIRSFNADKPYDRFVREQLAGDVLAPGDPEAQTALGFIAAGPWDFIGHVEVPESKIDGKVARNLDRDDMVCNTLNAFTSTTIQCARCHDHKFDPITMEHYYSLQAVFASIDRADRTIDASPEVAARRRSLEAERQAIQSEQREMAEHVKKQGGEELAFIKQEISELRKAKAGPRPPEHGWHSQMADKADTAKWVQVDLGKQVSFERIVLRACHDNFGNIGAGFGFPIRFRVEGSNDPAFRKDVVVLQKHQTDLPNPKLVPHVIRRPHSARYVRVTATKLFHRVDKYMVSFAELEVLDPSGVNLAAGRPVRSLDSIEAPNRWRRSNLTDGLFPRDAQPADPERLEAVLKRRRAVLAPIETEAFKARRTQLDRAEKRVETALAKLPTGRKVYVGTVHQGSGNFRGRAGLGPREIRILHRGEVTQSRDSVSPGTVPLVSGVDWRFNLPEDHPENARRLALADWIVRKDHPLTWRSIVNRVWHYHMGRGFVEAPNDFGRMGPPPSHPELLDWLAIRFRDDPSFKRLHRLIVTSSVYRQSSQHHAAHAAIDRDNQFLWRMNRRRLDAESLRDSVLSVSGTLDPKMFGPGYYLFRLEQTAHSPHYQYHKHDPDESATHRRSVYRFIVRSQPDPFMTTLDCADSSQSTPKRGETLTALQALSLLNNKFNLAMARHFAARVEAEAPDLPGRVERAYQLATCRDLGGDRREALIAYAEEHGLPNLCRLLFNLNEFLYVD